MSKMKSLFCIVAILSLALVSCVENLPETEMPDVDNGAITMIKATVEPLQLKGATGVGNYSWNETHTIGIYGSTMGENECYLPIRSKLGSNEAYFYGNKVGGDLILYMPYVETGSETALNNRVTVPAEQKYYADVFDHFMYNSTFVGVGNIDAVSFDYHAGLVKIEIQYNIQNIESVSVTVGNITLDGSYNSYIVGDISVDSDVEESLVNGSDRIVITDFPEGVHSTVDKPAVVWALAAPGIYENLVVEIKSDEGTTSATVKGPFVVEKCAVAEQVCTAKEIKYDNGIGDFEGENGEFNPKN